MSVDQKLRKLEEEMDKKPRTSLRASMGERQAARLTDARKQSLFNMLDVHGNGTINADEFNELYEAMKAETEQELAKEQALLEKAARSKRRMKLLGCFAAAMGVFLAVSVAANFSVTLGLLEATKDTRTTSSGALEVTDGSGHIARTAAAEESIPLFVVPVLADEQLFAISSTTVSYYDAKLYGVGGGDVDNYMVEASLSIAEVRKYNSTFVELITFIPGRTLTILNGQAYVVQQPTGDNMLSEPLVSNVCSSNVTCSSLTVQGADLDALSSLAIAELTKVGFAPAGRRLQSQGNALCKPLNGWTHANFPGFNNQFATDNGGNPVGFGSVADQWYTGYSCQPDVVFFFHGHGGTKFVYHQGGVFYKLRQNRYAHMRMIFPTSSYSDKGGTSCQGQQANPAPYCKCAWQSWKFQGLQNPFGDASSYGVVGAPQVATFMANWQWSTGPVPGGKSRVFATGHSDGGAMSAWMSLVGFSGSGYANSFGGNTYATASSGLSGIPFGMWSQLQGAMPSQQQNKVDIRVMYSPDDFSYAIGLTSGAKMIEKIGIHLGAAVITANKYALAHRAPYQMNAYGPSNHVTMADQLFYQTVASGGGHRVVLDLAQENGACDWATAGLDLNTVSQCSGSGGTENCCNGLSNRFGWYHDTATPGKHYKCDRNDAWIPGLCAHLNISPAHGSPKGMSIFGDASASSVQDQDHSDFALEMHDTMMVKWLVDHGVPDSDKKCVSNKWGPQYNGGLELDGRSEEEREVSQAYELAGGDPNRAAAADMEYLKSFAGCNDQCVRKGLLGLAGGRPDKFQNLAANYARQAWMGTRGQAGDLPDYVLADMESLAATCNNRCNLDGTIGAIANGRRLKSKGASEKNNINGKLQKAGLITAVDVREEMIKEIYRSAAPEDQVEIKKNMEEESCSASGNCLKPTENPVITQKKPIKQANPTKTDHVSADPDLRQQFTKKDKEGNVVKDENGNDELASTRTYYDTILTGVSGARMGLADGKRSQLMTTFQSKLAAYQAA